MLALWQKLKILWKFFESLFWIVQHIESSLSKKVMQLSKYPILHFPTLDFSDILRGTTQQVRSSSKVAIVVKII